MGKGGGRGFTMATPKINNTCGFNVRFTQLSSGNQTGHYGERELFCTIYKWVHTVHLGLINASYIPLRLKVKITA
jgi:hypothetical protein